MLHLDGPRDQSAHATPGVDQSHINLNPAARSPYLINPLSGLSARPLPMPVEAPQPQEGTSSRGKENVKQRSTHPHRRRTVTSLCWATSRSICAWPARPYPTAAAAASGSGFAAARFEGTNRRGLFRRRRRGAVAGGPAPPPGF